VVSSDKQIVLRPVGTLNEQGRTVPMNLSQFFGLTCLGLLIGMPTSAQETCPHPEGWKPTDAELQQVLSDHRQWVQKQETAPPGVAPSDGRANLCNADLRQVELNEAVLSGANLNQAILSGAKLARANLDKAELSLANLNEAYLAHAYLNEAKLSSANLNEAYMAEANLNKAELTSANLNKADLSNANLNEAVLLFANLNEAVLSGANLNNADLSLANLNKADLSHANLKEAKLLNAKLNEAFLFEANLNKAELTVADLNKAELTSANLNEAVLSGANLNEAVLSGAKLQKVLLRFASVAGTHFDYADLTGAYYAPKSPAPDAYVAQIKGLETLDFPDGEDAGLVQLRDLLQKAGLRDLERQATFAIESGRTNHSIARRTPGDIAEGVFRKVAFDWTTRYGLQPARALFSIAVVWALLIPVYSWPIWRQPKQAKHGSGVYRVLPKDRIEVRDGEPTLDNPARVERLHVRGLATIAWSAYFSLLSAFQIGFREFSVGTWLTRAQPRIFALEATGWVRTVSGLQSLLSVYLLAMWLLTYFGRPFQ